MKLPGALKKIDTFGACILTLLACLVIGAAYAALHFGWFRSPWEMAAWLFVGVAFLAVGLGSHGSPPQRNAKAHGDARPADQEEAKMAARGETGGPKLSERQFKD